ncbi:hypothetical protein Poli38472_005815 [Pythium oligandrum]|uniref:YdbS-like PH domain-containing protein n=1 Tax=Pythium oligandrum TaxID=41045 RepID=A0A8K1CR93_PYTOL|nr:hypothetical protein Poli38472_005815 [Pythium oligandrum]|eukprot:TMW68347.1 hypothetical protein Poli38472_005815 [Pythium oligandrum]
MCLPCIPCLIYCQHKEVDSLHCKVTSNRVEFEGGWMNHVSKNIPLDRIQDVSLDQGCCQRMFGIKALGIQTAGAGGPVPEIYLMAPKNAEMVRDEIMRRRDMVVLGHNGRPTAAMKDSVKRVAFNQVVPVPAAGGVVRAPLAPSGVHTTLSITSDEAVLLELRELKEALLRIEKHVEGVDKML